MNKLKGFTLIEVILVIAIISVLISIIAPRGIIAYKKAQIDSVVASRTYLKTALSQSFVKNKRLFTGATSVPNNTLEGNLISEDSMDSSALDMINLGVSEIHTITVINPCPMPFSPSFDGIYDINNDNLPDTCGQTVVEIQISQITDKEGHDISLIIDGASETSAIGLDDLAGKVKYSVESGAGGNGVALILVENN